MAKIKRMLLPNGKAHGWRPDRRDPLNDWTITKKLAARVPRSALNQDIITLDPQTFPRIRNQGSLGSCTGFGLRSAILQQMLARYGDDKLAGEWGKKYDLSPLAMYYLGRELENSIDEDTGCEIRDVVLACREHGIPTEASWPYRPKKFTEKPSAEAYKTGRWHQAAPESYRLDDPKDGGNREKIIDRMAQAIQAGMPIVYGFYCYPNLDDAWETGVVPMPSGRMNGGHCVNGFTMDFRNRIVWGSNSWNNDWGGKPPVQNMRFDERGYIGLPFAFFTEGYADDAWAVGLEAEK